MDRKKQGEENFLSEGIAFEWYAAKAGSNLEDHNVSFEEACTVFGDPDLVELADAGHSEDEERFIGIGLSQRGRLLFVNYTEREPRVRIISARLAERWERREYEGTD